MLLDGPNSDQIGDKSVLKDEEGKGNGHTNHPAQGDLSRVISGRSQADSVMSVVRAEPEPEADRIAMLEHSNQRIEAMLRALTTAREAPGSPSTTAAGSINRRKVSHEDNSLHATDQYYVPPMHSQV